MAISDDEKKSVLIEICNQIQPALSQVATKARSKLTPSPGNTPGNSLAVTTNAMIGNQVAERKLKAITLEYRDDLKRLEREPFNARVVVRWADKGLLETIYVSRPSAAGILFEQPGVKLATYVSPLGRLAEFKAGARTTITIGGRQRKVTILERVILTPKIQDGEWDAIDDYFEFPQWKTEIDSILQLLKQHQPKTAPIDDISDFFGDFLDSDDQPKFRDLRKRKVIQDLSLPDQFLLDPYQGEVFRMPLNQRLILLGPPGTGKTTTLIRRLAQKRTHEALTSEELIALDNAGLGKSFLDAHSWVMFIPTDLLKNFIEKAFNRERVALNQGNLQTWEKERLNLARNVLGILRSSQTGQFLLNETDNILADPSNTGIYELYQEFVTFLDNETMSRLGEAYHLLHLSGNNELLGKVSGVLGQRPGAVGFSVREMANLIEDAPQLQPEIKKLEVQIDQILKDLLQLLLKTHKELREEIVLALPTFFQEVDVDDQEEDEESEGLPILQPKESDPEVERKKRALAGELLKRSLRDLARLRAQGRSNIGGRSGEVIKFLGDRLPPRESLLEVGKHILTVAQLRNLIQSPQRFVMKIPQAYDQFRRQAFKEGRLFGPEAGNAIQGKQISAGETDVLILTMLRNTRRLLEENSWRLATINSPDWLENIKGQYRMQVFVDEATDFSSVQLACTIELSHPRLRSWFACGDFNQRLTNHGAKDVTELQWLSSPDHDSIQIREINISYRQSRRLRELSQALAPHKGFGQPEPQAPEHMEDADFWPLLAENCSGDQLAKWVAQRIIEVERANEKLPSTAVFVNDESLIAPLVQLLRPLLAQHSIPVAGFQDGRTVGDDLELRVFKILDIKGLEFEAVFFVGIDRMAERFPDLFEHFFYVGASRARTFLGVTCEGSFPAGMERIRGHFSSGEW